MDENRIDPHFRQLLATFDVDAVERQEGVVYGLWPDLRLAYFNPAWFRFAANNNGEPGISRDWPIGASVVDATPRCLRPFYNEFFGVLTSRQIGNPLRHDYECSSEDVFRRFLMTVYPLGGGEGLLVANSLVVEIPHGPAVHPRHRAADLYVDQQGLIHQCGHCRRVQNATDAERWDWVPQWVRRPPPETSHTLCPLCFDHYYGS